MATITANWFFTRWFGGDAWEQAEVPLGEESERYDLEILNAAGTTVMRTVAGLDEPSWTYASADQTSDFGAPIAAIRFRVCQRSATFGRGIQAELAA